MVPMTTVDTDKLIPSAVSSVPLPAQAAVLRGVRRIFPFQANPVFLTETSQTLREKVVQPVRQPSIQAPGKRSSAKVCDVLQVFNAQHTDVGPIDLLQSVAHEALDTGMGMFLAFCKALNRLVGGISRGLAIREHQAVLVVGIHTHHIASHLERWPGFLHHHLDKQAPFTPPQPRGLRQRPARSEQAIEVLSAVKRQRETRSARANETQGVVKMGAAKGLQAHEVRVERGGPAAHPRLTVFIGMGGPADFFRLLGQGLRQSRCDTKTVTASVDSRQISQVRRKVLALPEQVDKVLRHISALVEKVADNSRFAGVEIVQEEAGTAVHHGRLLVGFPHGVVPCNALMAAVVFCRPRRCPYRRASNDIRMIIRFSMRSLVSLAARLMTSILKGHDVSNHANPNRISHSLCSTIKTSKSRCLCKAWS